MKVFVTLGSVIILFLLIGWIGLQIKPGQFPAYPSGTSDSTTIPLPDDLPAPVAHFYRQLYGEDVPMIESAVISGRGRLRIKGITLPARFRFTHSTGQDYRHYIETTLFGLPVMKVNEHFLNGVSRLELPFGVSDGVKVDQGANLALWAEAIWMPSVWVTDPQAQWEALDENSAVLIVPFGEMEERITVHFDPQSGMLRSMESMRYKESTSMEKTLWTNEVLEWNDLEGHLIPVETSVTWFDEGTPWAYFTVEEIAYNTDVGTYIELSGLGQ
jgi:hypothetical protein